MKRIIFPLSVLLVLLFLLSGCTDKRQETCIQRANEYLKFLEGEAEGDTLTLLAEIWERTDGYYTFRAHSEVFGGDFQIRVAPDKTVTDDYYTLAVLSEAETVYGPAVPSALPGRDIPCTVGVKSILTPALSGRTGSSLITVQNAAGGQPIVYLDISVPDGETLTEKEIGTVLYTLYASACPCEVYISDDPRTFVVEGDGVYYLTAEADGGSYIKRHEYSFED